MQPAGHLPGNLPAPGLHSSMAETARTSTAPRPRRRILTVSNQTTGCVLKQMTCNACRIGHHLPDHNLSNLHTNPRRQNRPDDLSRRPDRNILNRNRTKRKTTGATSRTTEARMNASGSPALVDETA